MLMSIHSLLFNCFINLLKTYNISTYYNDSYFIILTIFCQLFNYDINICIASNLLLSKELNDEYFIELQ